MNRRGFLKSSLSVGIAPAVLPQSVLARERSSPIRLNANENPLGLSPAARKTVSGAISDANRYPWAEASELVSQLSQIEGVGETNIILGNGSSEILRLAVQALGAKGSLVVAADPTYEAVKTQATSVSLATRQMPLTRQYSHDVSRMRDVADEYDGPVLIYICNPNNPTGTITPSPTIIEWIKTAPREQIFLVDEAYHHYVEDPSYQTLLQFAPTVENLLVTRTFSKVFAMAGLRLGYGVGNQDLISRLQRLTRLNTNSLALSAASASLKDHAFVARSLASNREAKQVLFRGLADLNIRHLPSQTNFAMFRLKDHIETFNQRMTREGFLVGRTFSPMTDHCRITIGLPEEMASFVRTLRKFRQRGWI